jgi:cytidylate kinase
MKKLIVAIDGPAGAGKSTVARIVAERLQYIYIDTGAMYRAVTWEVITRKVAFNDEALIADTARTLDLSLDYKEGKTRVKVNGVDITEEIRTPEISRSVSEISKIGAVREAMVSLQRQLAGQGGVVMDGRDIGTFVLPNADVKVFLTAAIEERAKRRWRELVDKGFTVDLEQLKEEIACRDRKDCERDIAPLIQAKDAVAIDTTKLTIDEAVACILKLCEERASAII